MMQKVRDDLRGAGFVVWTDEGLEVGTSSWERDIEGAIRNTGCLVVLLSPDANQSEWVGREFTFANIHKKRIFPILLRGDETNAIPLRLAQHNYVDVRHNYADGMARMMGDIRRHLNMPQPTPAYITPSQPQQSVYTPPPKPVEKPIKNDFIVPRTSASGAKRGFPTFMVIGGVVIVVIIALILLISLLNNQDNLPSVAENGIPTVTSTPQVGFTSITPNMDWTPVEQDFDGVIMVLVPAGCFMMGSEDGEDNEQPIHEQCFNTSFWIDKYEVTQAQFIQFNGQKTNSDSFTGLNRPVERITWFEARDYCENQRDGRLPTEREWEYAARGPGNLIYPWGNEFVTDNVVYNANSNNQTADVGSRPNGISWVGALDMSGNVWEWVSSLYAPYPYDENDESVSDNSSARVLRGGSWNYTDFVVRSAFRGWNDPTVGDNFWGIRCVRSFENVPSETVSSTPTLSPELFRNEVNTLYAILDTLENPLSGTYVLLNRFWTDRTRTACDEPDPIIPENYVIDLSILEHEDVSLVRELQLAAQDINVILNFLRGDPTQPAMTTGWADFRYVCANNLLNDETEIAQATAYNQFLADSLVAVRAKLDNIRGQL